MLGCPIRKSWDQRLFAPPPSLSQLITSFIASQSLGIHRSLLFAFFILFARTCKLDAYQCVSTNTQCLLYRIALLYYFFLSFFQYIKDRYLVDSWQLSAICLTTNPLNVLIVSGSILIICITFFTILQKKTTRWSIFVENIGLEPMTPCVQGRCSKPTELIPRVQFIILNS